MNKKKQQTYERCEWEREGRWEIRQQNVHVIVSLSRFLTLEAIKEAIVSSCALIRLRRLRQKAKKKARKIDYHSAYDIWFELDIRLSKKTWRDFGFWCFPLLNRCRSKRNEYIKPQRIEYWLTLNTLYTFGECCWLPSATHKILFTLHMWFVAAVCCRLCPSHNPKKDS